MNTSEIRKKNEYMSEIQGCIFFYIRPPCWGGKFFKNFELGKVFKIHVRGKEGEKGKKWGKGKKGRREKEGKFPP